MVYYKFLSACFICLFIAACDKQEPPAAVKKETVMKAAPEKIIPGKTVPVLNLSIDNIAIEQPNINAVFLNDKTATEENSELFKTLNKEQAEANIDISGKLLTDEEKFENKEYLDAVEGVQINVEGRFK